jgi:hypothetical protein
MIMCDNNGNIVSWGELRSAHPNVSFPKLPNEEVAQEFGFNVAVLADRPVDELGKRVIRNTSASLVNGVWTVGWTIEDVPVTSQQVKDEAYRRIIAIVPEWKQRNLTAQASQLAEKGRANWTAEELAAWNAGQVIWDQVAAIRAKSDALEAMSPIPVDYKDDRWWV